MTRQWHGTITLITLITAPAGGSARRARDTLTAPSKANVWIASPTLPYAIPAGAAIERIELYYKLTNGKSADAQTFVWADNVRLTTSAAAFPFKAWTEIVR